MVGVAGEIRTGGIVPGPNELIDRSNNCGDGETESRRDLATPSHRRGNVGASARSGTRSRHVRRRRRPHWRRWRRTACPWRPQPYAAEEPETLGSSYLRLLIGRARAVVSLRRATGPEASPSRPGTLF